MAPKLETNPGNQQKIVLVHLGPTPATHLWVNLESLLNRFTNMQIVLISDRKHTELPDNPRFEFFEYLRSEDSVTAFSNLDHDFEFRSGFWQFTLERFMAIEQFHSLYPELRIFHIESDILLLPGFPFEQFAKLEKLAWQRVDDIRDVASIFFTPGHRETKWFLSELLRLLKNQNALTDMTALNQIRSGHPSLVQVLPSHSTALSPFLYWNEKEDYYLASNLSDNQNDFNGIFDPAAYGMWLSGSDPRNYHGLQILFDTDEIMRGGTYIDPSKYQYILSISNELFCMNRPQLVRVWSLHIHSKDLRLLGDGWNQRLREVVELSSKNRVYSEFHLDVLVKLAISNIRSRTFISWILHIRKLKPILRVILKVRSRIRAWA